MNLFKSLFDTMFSNNSTGPLLEINPANGLPMIENSHIDVQGNLYGTDNNTSHSSHDWGGVSSHGWGSSSSSFGGSDW